jgi:adenylosuccinate lyase
MLARTHGQPATPTRVGKELLVFVERLDSQLALLRQVPFKAKFGGATGQFNAHKVAYPTVDWVSVANKYVDALGNREYR